MTVPTIGALRRAFCDLHHMRCNACSCSLPGRGTVSQLHASRRMQPGPAPPANPARPGSGARHPGRGVGAVTYVRHRTEGQRPERYLASSKVVTQPGR
jgi:hypothetical protein